jgi:hypothetical protein
MGAWGHKPLENDTALDLKGEFEESNNDIKVLERALDVVADLKDDQSVEASDAEAAIAAAQMIKDLRGNKTEPEDRNRLTVKVDKALTKILANSEIKELWIDSPEYDKWVSSTKSLK